MFRAAGSAASQQRLRLCQSICYYVMALSSARSTPYPQSFARLDACPTCTPPPRRRYRRCQQTSPCCYSAPYCSRVSLCLLRCYSSCQAALTFSHCARIPASRLAGQTQTRTFDANTIAAALKLIVWALDTFPNTSPIGRQMMVNGSCCSSCASRVGLGALLWAPNRHVKKVSRTLLHSPPITVLLSSVCE